MFDYVFDLVIEFIGVLGWYIPILILFSFLYAFFNFKARR